MNGASEGQELTGLREGARDGTDELGTTEGSWEGVEEEGKLEGCVEGVDVAVTSGISSRARTRKHDTMIGLASIWSVL